MPRGIPNAKRDDMGMKFTTFHVPLPPNPKHTNSSYLKYETQTVWARNGRNRVPEEQSEGRRGSKVIVIHPGSRWLRIGRASDVKPLSIPHVVARKHKPPVHPPTFIPSISRPQKKSPNPSSDASESEQASTSSEDPFDARLAPITNALRERMRFYKLRVTPNAVQIANSFNERFEPEIIADYNDPFRIDWMLEPKGDVIVGEEVSEISDPVELGYAIKYPILGTSFNTRDYSSLQAILNDLEVIWTTTLKEKLGIDPKTLGEYSVILVIPDIWEKFYVRELLNLLLNSIGFKQACVQQQSLAATYGAGVSNACVVDIGATKTSIACVDDGMVIPETRILLNIGGDDITEFLHVLLERISFPYRDIDLSRSYDWNLMEDLKSRLCTLSESDVALNLYDFVVRRPGKSTEKYGLRAYDEVILAPMCLFLPSVVNYDQKRVNSWSVLSVDVTDGVPETIADRITGAMKVSTEYLFTEPSLTAVAIPVVENSVTIVSESATPLMQPQPDISDVPVAQLSESTTPTNIEGTVSEVASTKAEESAADIGAPSAVHEADGANGTDDVEIDVEDTKAPAEPLISPNLPPVIPDSDAQINTPAQELRHTPQQASFMSSVPVNGQSSIDVFFEASKLPLDVAIVNSPRGTQQDEKVRKYLQAVLVVGGTARLPGMVHALESRLQANANSVVSNMDKVQIIPSPKDVDPRVLVWKGAAVLGKMDGVSDLWVNASEWNLFGLRGLKERCYFL